MSLAPLSSLAATHLRGRLPALLAQAARSHAHPYATVPGTGASSSADPLQSDPCTTKPQQVAHETDEATKDSIRHAAEGEFGEAVKDVGKMVKNAAKGAKESAKLMYDSVKQKKTGKGASEEVKEDLRQGK